VLHKEVKRPEEFLLFSGLPRCRTVNEASSPISLWNPWSRSFVMLEKEMERPGSSRLVRARSHVLTGR
jgi:hypothetical protein